VTIELPPGWQVSAAPAGKDIDGHVVNYSLKVTNDHSTLHLTRKVSMDFLWLDQKYYAPLRNFFQNVRTNDEQQILLQPGAASTAN